MAKKKLFEHSNFGYLSNTYVVKKVGIERIFFLDNEKNDLNTLFLAKKRSMAESSQVVDSLVCLTWITISFPKQKDPKGKKNRMCVVSRYWQSTLMSCHK